MSKQNYEIVKNILTDFENGDTINTISIRYNLYRGTIRNWIKKYRSVTQLAEVKDSKSLKCGFDSHQTYQTPEYAYIFGVYLGDGYIIRNKRTYKLMFSILENHTEVQKKISSQLKILFPFNKINILKRKNSKCCDIIVYSNNIPLLFPQYGSGHKHERKIETTELQRFNIITYPKEFLSGLLDSDGTSYIQSNLRFYMFKNKSVNIVKIFCDTCDLLDIKYTVVKFKSIYSVYIRRKKYVRLLETFYTFKK